MNNKEVILTPYSHESFLPCELKKIVYRIKRKMITENKKVSLKKNIYAIPLNRGYILHTKEVILVTNDLHPFQQINGKYSVNELSKTPEMKSFLEQLYYYDLISFESKNNGQVIIKDDVEKYRELYGESNFVTFPLVPLTVEIDITNACNFRCIHCSRNSGPRRKNISKDELSTKEIQNIIDQCAQLGVLELILMGGEPLYHSDFFKLVKYAKERGIRDVRTSTNGWFINENIAKKLSKYFNNIQISIHGASSSVHDSITGREGAWEQAQRAIKLLKKYNLKVNVSFTVMRENVNDVQKIPYLVKEWGADSLRFIRLNQQGRGRLLKGWDEKEILQIGNEIKKIYENLSGLELDAGGFPPLRSIKNDASFYGCSAGKTLLSIASDGMVRVCGSVDEYIGNVKEQTLLEIWHSPELIEMRKQQKCNCNYRQICYGSCLVKL